jgi:hypothetical protein
MTRILLSAPLCPYILLSSRFTCWPEIRIVPMEHDAQPHQGDEHQLGEKECESKDGVHAASRQWNSAQRSPTPDKQ